MTRGSKRKSDDQKSEPIKKNRVEPVRSGTTKAATKVQERVDQLYKKYANQSSNMIEPEGIEALCSDLKDEWQRGLKSLQADTIGKLKKRLPGLEKEVLKSENFDDFYRFSFRYCLTEDKQKCLDIETSCTLLELVLKSRHQHQVESFIKFLKIQKDYKSLNMDQWTNFLRFCQEMNFPGLENYNTCEAWPIILDNFVDWMNQEADV